jgi:hypothetical protein
MKHISELELFLFHWHGPGQIICSYEMSRSSCLCTVNSGRMNRYQVLHGPAQI